MRFFYRFHVLRTYRRAALWKQKAESECQQVFLAAMPAPCPKMPPKSETSANIWPTWRSKIEAGAAQVAKKTTNRRDKCSKTRKMRSRGAEDPKKCQLSANMTPILANLEPFWPFWATLGPPLVN